MPKLVARGANFDSEELEGEYIYFISDETAIKIGKSNDPLKRLNQLQIGNPRDLKLLGTSPLLDEYELHEKFKDKLIRGEWFKICDDILNFCNENKTLHYNLSKKDKKELIEIIINSEVN